MNILDIKKMTTVKNSYFYTDDVVYDVLWTEDSNGVLILNYFYSLDSNNPVDSISGEKLTESSFKHKIYIKNNDYLEFDLNQKDNHDKNNLEDSEILESTEKLYQFINYYDGSFFWHPKK